MLQKLGDHIAGCRERAAECYSRANETKDAAIRPDYLDMADRWNHLADAYVFVETLERFLVDTHKNGWPFNVEKIPTPPKDLFLARS